jgi:hypothetical protein
VDGTTQVVTVTINGVNDAPVAVADRVITNAGSTGTVVVPEWALLANDSDVDGPLLDIVETSNSASLTANLSANPGSVTLADTGGAAVEASTTRFPMAH